MSQQTAPSDLSIIICTFNGAERLPAVFDALVVQKVSPGFSWDVLVIDNGSTDGTRSMVEAFAQTGALPKLRYVMESKPGLTAARTRGVRETEAAWIAFVDDDNLLDAGWIAAIGRAIGEHPGAGGVGGEIKLDWEAPPPEYLGKFGFCFAEQQVGPQARRAHSLAGAGMVLKRQALVASGWAEQPLLADRTGKSLVSGGDVEIAQRVRAAGFELWLTPEAVLRHRIPEERMTRRYLFEINAQLGISSAVVGVLTWPGDWFSWRSMAYKERARWVRIAALGAFWSAVRMRDATAAIAWASFAKGYARGVRRCLRLPPDEQRRLLGAGAARDN